MVFNSCLCCFFRRNLSFKDIRYLFWNSARCGRFSYLILVLDTLAVIPFAVLRADQRPIKYSVVKILNVLINAGLTVLFLYLLPEYLKAHPTSTVSAYFIPDFQVGYLF